jgi:hypothetical protein
LLEHDEKGLPLDLLAHLPAGAASTAGVAAPRVPPAPRLQLLPWVVALAACLLILATAAIVLDQMPRPSAPPPIARLTRAIDCRWEAGEEARTEGANLGAGDKLYLESGIAELTLDTGVRITLSGPAALELAAREAVVLHHGRLTAFVPEEAAGFAVRAPGFQVVDLGTEFGLQVKNGTAEVHVFEGKVELEATDAQWTLPRTLLEKDQAVRIDHRGDVEELSAQPTGFLRDAGLQASPNRILLRDDFLVSDLDLEKWKVILPSRQSAVKPGDGRVELRARGHLITAQEYDPVLLQGLRITGVCRFDRFLNDGQGNFEMLRIYTRSDAVVGPAHQRDAMSGIRFRVETRQPRPSIAASGPLFRVSNRVSVGHLSIREGDEFRFEIIDDGRNLSITLTSLVDPTNTATTTATVSLDTSDTNHVVFHNREGRHVVQLRDLEVATGIVPLPEVRRRPQPLPGGLTK